MLSTLRFSSRGTEVGEGYATHRLLTCPLCLACQANSPGKWEIWAPGSLLAGDPQTVILVGSLSLSHGRSGGKGGCGTVTKQQFGL